MEQKNTKNVSGLEIPLYFCSVERTKHPTATSKNKISITIKRLIKMELVLLFAAVVSMMLFTLVIFTNNTNLVEQLPVEAKEFIQSNYADTAIINIDKGNNGYQVELSNRLYLKFNDCGQLIGFGY
jgi:hypothetical protein